MATKHIMNIHHAIKTGYTEYGLYFWIISLSTLIGGFFGMAGLGAMALSFWMFYWLGKFHVHVAPPSHECATVKRDD